MTNSDSRHDKTAASKAWIAVKRLDLNDNRITAFREISMSRGASAEVVEQIIKHSLGLTSDQVVLKIRNSSGFLIPLNSQIPANGKHSPHVLEVVRFFQNVVPKPRIITTNALNKSMKARLQSVLRRIERLEELVPQIKLRHKEKISQEIEYLRQKITFLNKRMQMADSQCWRGTFTRPPLW